MILFRSILKELFINSAVIVFSLSILLFMEKFVGLTRLFLGKGVDPGDLARIFLYLQPSIMLLAVPMAIIIAVFLTYGRMSTDSELVVLKGSGMSFWGISRSALFFSFFCFILLSALSLYVLPRSMHSFKATLNEIIIKKASTTFEEESFSDVFKDTVIYIQNIPARDEFQGIFIYRNAEKTTEQPVVIVAEKGVVSSNPKESLINLTMSNGFIHTFKENASSEISFSEYDLVLTSGIDPATRTRPEEIRTGDLWKGRKERLQWSVELHRRIALPFACLIFGILGPALTNRIGKIGRLGGFSLSLAILTLYYFLLVMGESLAKAGKIQPFWGGWAPNVFFGILALLLFYKAHKDRPIKKL